MLIHRASVDPGPTRSQENTPTPARPEISCEVISASRSRGKEVEP
jgi:hypothetical protein